MRLGSTLATSGGSSVVSRQQAPKESDPASLREIRRASTHVCGVSSVAAAWNAQSPENVTVSSCVSICYLPNHQVKTPSTPRENALSFQRYHGGTTQTPRAGERPWLLWALQGL